MHLFRKPIGKPVLDDPLQAVAPPLHTRYGSNAPLCSACSRWSVSNECRLALAGTDRIRLRGYVGVPLFGRTTTWTRVGAEHRACATAKR